MLYSISFQKRCYNLKKQFQSAIQLCLKIMRQALYNFHVTRLKRV